MSTVFLIGNGFDLSCGMKTRYTDMYKDYCKTNEGDSTLIKQFKQDISNNEYDTWADFELGMADYVSKLSNENASSKRSSSWATVNSFTSCAVAIHLTWALTFTLRICSIL